jgi:hypothetical protein
MNVYQELFPAEYASVQDNQFPAANEGYLGQPMTPIPSPFSFPAYNLPVPATYTSFPQNIAYTGLPALSAPYASSMTQGQFVVDGSSLTPASGSTYTPITPTSLADGLPTHEGPLYGIDFTQTYVNAQLPVTEAYAHTNTSVNPSDFFRQNYPSS